ncbi:MAG: hypothetical protein ACOC89_02665 [Candidatus Saliniplasma sp.]
MNRKDRDYLRKALSEQRPHERYNKALSRVISERMKSKAGYKKYLELIDEVRKFSRKNDCSIEDAVKEIIS